MIKALNLGLTWVKFDFRWPASFLLCTAFAFAQPLASISAQPKGKIDMHGGKSHSYGGFTGKFNDTNSTLPLKK